MIHGGSGPIVPPPDAVPSVGHARGRRVQQAPVTRPPGRERIETFAGIRGNMVLVVRLQVHDHAGRDLVPLAGHIPGVDPAQAGFLFGMTGLVPDDLQPVLVPELLCEEYSASNMRGDRGVNAGPEDAAPDPTPPFRVLRLIAPVSHQDPHYGVRTPACGHVAAEQNGLVLGQHVAGVAVRIGAVDRVLPQHDRRADHAGAIDRVEPGVQPAEELRIDAYPLAAFERLPPVAVAVGRCAPLGGNPLNG